ncbi:uncharacterized protein MRET_3337 [Malassezia restricta]|uniref:uncharacterized protein n=1 Tax=Malassezia restricta TaxID=76775 RepID=UPI000DD1790F|nr:uncharacterized protein MRET_3337 [Malassezia restricta]AXA50961.1 uncharacterized protein MRET_3337 [Malassezia restricta]
MSSQEGTAHIQPHPARDNHPAPTGLDRASGAVQAPPGLQTLDATTASQLEQPLSDEELKKRSEALNATNL